MSALESLTATPQARRASVADTVRVATRVVLPTLAAGVIVRRPRIMALAEKLQFDRSAIRLLTALRLRYGDGPLRLAVPGRKYALLLDPDQVREVLRDSAQRFTPANREKRAALRHFQPHGVLISRGRSRALRRNFHENVLEMDRPVHELGPRVAAAAAEEGARIVERAQSAGRLGWDDFAAGWWRAVRRVVLGDSARDDRRLIELLNELRADANWAFAHPRRESRRREFSDRLHAHLARADSGSLASTISNRESTAEVDPDEQVPHWLFAFDAAAMIAFRALALLASHPEQMRAVRAELDEARSDAPLLPYLRSCLLESVRLWPTTPALLRDAVTEAECGGQVLPAGTGVFIFTPLFHRDETTMDNAHRFTPESWSDGTMDDHPAIVPFSAGPGRCPGENVVLLTASTLLAALIRGHEFHLRDDHGLGSEPLPCTLNNFGLVFDVAASPGQEDRPRS
ncbi:cytochrome P450 [Saccharopolyspora gloriosae]|uniref:cytochrome P450 n=1 Tax=Saccharopolyspora gloriosae TaxID=455344 RepID=UPI001FB72A11|nr:cytochrome P450 [Saccharopolyspora gloriosae]